MIAYLGLPDSYDFEALGLSSRTPTIASRESRSQILTSVGAHTSFLCRSFLLVIHRYHHNFRGWTELAYLLDRCSCSFIAPDRLD